MSAQMTPVIQVGIAEKCLDWLPDVGRVHDQKIDISTLFLYDTDGNQINGVAVSGSSPLPAQEPKSLLDAVHETMEFALATAANDPDTLTNAGLEAAELQATASELRGITEAGAMVLALKERFDIDPEAEPNAHDTSTSSSANALGLCCFFGAKCCRN